MAATVSYTPGPHEQAYYQGLFQMADSTRSGNITGGDAVSFFSRSKLQVDTLKNIWTVADQPATTTLDHRKFAVAIRLIQLAQNGQKAQGATLAAPPGVALRPAFFEGITGVALPAPPVETPTLAHPPTQQQQVPPVAGPPRSPMPQYAQPQPPQHAQPSPSPCQRTPKPQHAASPLAHQQMQVPIPPMSAPAPPVMSTALTPQDPYTLTPQEQQRYEALFPQYQKPDGFIYGTEAVALFSKSGLSTENLRDIWNMVDIDPVDNRLDKLEFAMAMHLIVCISKKNLPCPSKLPYSLKVLKLAASETSSAPAPEPLPIMPTLNHSVPPSPVRMSVPPPLTRTQVQTMDISDAFEGLNAGSTLPPIAGFGGFGGTPSYVHGAPEPTRAPVVETVDDEPLPSPTMRGMSTFESGSGASAVITPPEPPKTTQQLAANYNLGDTHAELGKLQVILQKLQAENISLKAQVGAMTEEEKDVQRQIGATVEEIAKLSSDLTILRAQVLSAKSKLLESTSELQAGKQKIGVLTDLISETRATKDAILTADHDINDAISHPVSSVAPVSSNNYEQNLFGYDLAPAPMADSGGSFGSGPPAPASYEEPADIWGAPGQTSTPRSAPFMPSIPAPPFESGTTLSQVPSYEEDGLMGGLLGSASGSLAPTPNNYNVSAPPVTTTLSSEDVGTLKSQALAAEHSVRQSEEMYLTLHNEAEKLRQSADAAEAEAQALQEKASKLGRGLGGKKKKAIKEAEVASADAAEKRKHFMELQGQADNAERNIPEMKRKAEQLRQQFEEAELEFASAESVKWSQPSVPAPSGGNALEVPVHKSSGGYPNYGLDSSTAAHAFGKSSAVTGFGNGMQITDYSGGFGAPPPNYGGGFGAGLMPEVSSGGGGIPTPPRVASPAHDPYGSLESSDPYSNPF